jgi:hypothetical protein
VSFVAENNNGKLTGAFYGQDGKRLEADQIPRVAAKGNEQSEQDKQPNTLNHPPSQSTFALPEDVLAIASARSPEAVRPNDRNEGGEKTFRGIKRANITEEGEKAVEKTIKRRRVDAKDAVDQMMLDSWNTLKSDASLPEKWEASRVTRVVSALRQGGEGYQMSGVQRGMFENLPQAKQDKICAAYPNASPRQPDVNARDNAQESKILRPAMANVTNTEAKALNPAQKGQVIDRVPKRRARVNVNVKDKRLVKARQRVASPPARSFQRSVSMGR